ncbi:hypothetical protein F3Y22_tig00111059pilonHSYRG00273 [Hibiscus syriacus]|uniref:Reverse transcriptase zinc-binding domain-containing protein n=1 Tax=Hibiscus syriacus TaxID=106335 RepID=A0A6A2Z3U2_HIBSY|nr:hypothetical protein F3Y22_tig00111059pilonHSYRG00273 [Hibiscus syriacus]
MGLNIDNANCLFCGAEPETRNHLFFGCGFARDLWGNVLSLCGINRRVSTWDRELIWASQFLKGKTLIVLLLKLAFVGHVYSIWRERNSRLFGGRARPVGEVLNDICDSIRIRLSGWSINRVDRRNATLCSSRSI